MVAIVDYGVGNLFSLECSLRSIGADVVITGDPTVLEAADRIILPGVGAFGDAANKLKNTGIYFTLYRHKILCLGATLYFAIFFYEESSKVKLIYSVNTLRSPRKWAKYPHNFNSDI